MTTMYYFIYKPETRVEENRVSLLTNGPLGSFTNFPILKGRGVERSGDWRSFPTP